MADKIFVNGLIFKRPKEGAPDFVKGHLAAKVDDLVAFLQQHKKEDGWVNMNLKQSREGKLYLELDDWKPAFDKHVPLTPVSEMDFDIQ